MADDDSGERVRQVAVRLAAIAQSGLHHGESDYDLDRYAKLRELSAELFEILDGRPAASFAVELGTDWGYATPKVDVRGAIFDADERVLLMRERSDGLWSLPGGWADAGDTPSEAVVREIREETGHTARVTKLIACWDRDVQGHEPRFPVHAYKLFFLCTSVGEATSPDELETLDVGWFGLDELPPLSTGRVTERQLRRALDHHRDPALPTDLD